MTIWRNLNIGTKVLTALLPLILLSIALVSSISILIAQRELEEQAFNKLIATREIKATQIENYFSQIRHQIETFSENHMVISAMKDFAAAFKTILEEPTLRLKLKQRCKPASRNITKGIFYRNLLIIHKPRLISPIIFQTKKALRFYRIYILQIIPINWGQNISLLVQATTAGTVTIMRAITRSCEIF